MVRLMAKCRVLCVEDVFAVRLAGEFQCSSLRLQGTAVEIIYNAKCYFFYFKD